MSMVAARKMWSLTMWNSSSLQEHEWTLAKLSLLHDVSSVLDNDQLVLILNHKQGRDSDRSRDGTPNVAQLAGKCVRIDRLISMVAARKMWSDTMWNSSSLQAQQNTSTVQHRLSAAHYSGSGQP
jgi:hypothetical protein